MKKIFALLTTLLLMLMVSFATFAAHANVTYSGDAGKFVFAPGSKYSLTDLFSNFKDVMPGDSITQEITVRNLASNKVKVKIYMRSLGAHEDGESPDFLSQMHLHVEKSEDNTMPYMFDATAEKRAQLTDWVCLGTLYSGGEVNLNVTLDVPIEMDNDYAKKVGYLDWEFMIEEFPIEDSDPQTGDNTDMVFWVMTAAVTALFIIICFVRRKKESNTEN